MACALPYHATLQFVRLAQTLRLIGPWEWLAPMQRSGAPVPRASLVQRCLTDSAVLQHVCAGAAQQAGVRASFGAAVSATWMSFYAILVCEVIAAAPRVRSGGCAWGTHLNFQWPHANQGNTYADLF